MDNREENSTYSQSFVHTVRPVEIPISWAVDNENNFSSTTVGDSVHQATSSLYSQSLSMLQSPPLGSKEWSPSPTSTTMLTPPRPTVIAKSFETSCPKTSHGQFTALQSVTPSRLDTPPQQICGSGVQSEPLRPIPRQISSTLASPRTPFRLIAPDGSELKPIITKKGNGKISITYPLNMLANLASKQFPSLPQPAASPSLPMSTECFSQFLSHSDVSTIHPTPGVSNPDERGEVSTPLPASEVWKPQTSKMNVSSVAVVEGGSHIPNDSLVGFESASNQSMESNREDVGGDGDEEDDEEERQSMANITKALNIEVDVYKEKQKRRKTREPSSKLPKEVQGLMGEANLCYARGQHDNALKMCMEIIRNGPWCPDPYELLAMIFEERGETVKSLQYSLLAAHLQVGDVDNWLRLAESCEDCGFLQQAGHCYAKAIKLNPDDFKLYWAAAVIQQQLGNIHQALSLFKSVVRLIPESEAGQRMALARDIAKACHANNETALALEVMDEVACKHPNDVKYEDVNVMCELALASQQHRKVFDILVKHCQIEVQYESEEEVIEVFTPTYVKIPSDLPIDLKCKCVLASIPLGCFEIVHSLFEEICALDPSEYGDLQFDIAELLMEEKFYRKAIYALDILVQSKDYSLAAVWLKKGECHRELQEHYEEMTCFKEVIKSAPGHAKAYLVLCQVLRKLEKYREAVEVIQDAETYELEDKEQMLLNYETFKVYYEWAAVSKKRHEKLCKAADLGLLMLANQLESAFVMGKVILLRRERSIGGKYRGDVRVSRSVGKYATKHKGKKSLVAKGSPVVITNDEWWDIFLKTCDILHETERFVDGNSLIYGAMLYGPWNSVEGKTKLERMACSMSMLSGNFFLAYTYLRPWLLMKPSGNILWNLFNQVTLRSEDQRHHRFCLRSLVKDPESIALAVLTGHNSLATGTYKHSLGEYIRAHKQIPTEPLYMLLIGIIYTHIASQRFTTHKNSLVVQSLAFLNMYMKHRKCNQESYYNIGRAYHQIGLSHFAVHWYKKALATPPPECDVDKDVLDLRSEIAFNLAMLYRKSGNYSLAMKVLNEHCVV